METYEVSQDGKKLKIIKQAPPIVEELDIEALEGAVVFAQERLNNYKMGIENLYARVANETKMYEDEVILAKKRLEGAKEAGVSDPRIPEPAIVDI